MSADPLAATGRLSEHFELGEFLYSETAVRMGRQIEPTPQVITNLERLCVLVLEPIRVILGQPIRITSGYRPDWLNTLIGGAKNSEHRCGQAADFQVPGMSVIEVCNAVADMLPHLPINQLIYEFDAWAHVSVCAMGEEPKRQVLTARRVNRTTQYLPGIVRKAAA
jgi:zinc D-Ala-D-Ala carboxypeptidase